MSDRSQESEAVEAAEASVPDAAAEGGSAPVEDPSLEELAEGGARIVSEDGASTLVGRVEEVDSREITLHVPEPSGWVPPIARRVRFEFRPAKAEDVLTGAARPIEHRFDESGDHYVLQVEDRFAAQVGEALRNARAFRVELGGRVSVRVRAEGAAEDEDALEVSLKDISETGMSVLVDRAGEAHLAEAASQQGGGDWRLHLEFRLPGNRETLEVTAAVRYRALSRASVRYGLEFQGEDEAGRVEQRARIADHLMRFQGEMLRRAQSGARRAG